MFRSYFTAVSSALTDSRNLNVVSNNIANSGTTGFKRETPVSTTFAEVLLSRRLINDTAQIGAGKFVRLPEDSETDYSSGDFITTENPLNFAINGDAFFLVQMPNGDNYLTRDGEAKINADGYLELYRGGLLLDEDEEPIYVGTGNIEADRVGNIYVNDTWLGKLNIVRVIDTERQTKIDEGHFATEADNFEEAEDFELLWKTLELSNVDMTREMTTAIAIQRSFQANSQVMKILDSLTEKTVNEIARM